MANIIGKIIGLIITAIDEFTNASIAKALREVADRVERGDVVSDEEIDNLKGATAQIRKFQENLP